jgi:hypothetical protein
VPKSPLKKRHGDTAHFACQHPLWGANPKALKTTKPISKGEENVVLGISKVSQEKGSHFEILSFQI